MPILVGSQNVLQDLHDNLVNFGNQLNALDITFSSGGTITESIWKKTASNISPLFTTDKVSIGVESFIASEIFRVSGEANISTIRSANAYIDTARLRSTTYYTNLTSASLSASVNIVFPNKSGTVALLDDTQSLPNFLLVSTYTQTNANLALAVTNQHTHSNKAILDTYNQTNANITTSISYMHQHANKALLDAYSYTNTQIGNAVTNYHTHSNKALLDTYTQTEVDLASAVSLKHTHSNLSALNNLTQGIIDDSHTHANKPLLDSIINSGLGTLWLDDSGNYSTITETDPTVSAAIKAITPTQITNWDTSYTNTHTHSNKTFLDTLNDAGSSTQFLAGDGVYRTITAGIGGLDTQVVYNDGGVSAGDSTFTFDKSTKILSTNIITSSQYRVDSGTTYIDKDVSNNMTFTDAISGTVTLASILAGATNYWSPTTGGIYYANYISNHTNPTAELDITGHIIATDFDSAFLRYKNSNLLLGPNSGDNETGNNFLYIANSNTATPLIKGDFVNQALEFNADVYIKTIKRLCFDSSDTFLRKDTTTGDLIFSDLNTNSGNPVKLSELFNAGDYALKSDFTSYSAVTSITNANKTTWNKASVLVTSGVSTKFLAEDGVYYTVSGGGVTPTDNFAKWDSGSSFYRFYSSKVEAGGAASSGKFYLGTIDPTATNRLNYDGYFHSTAVNTNYVNINSVGNNGSISCIMNLSGYIGDNDTNIVSISREGSFTGNSDSAVFVIDDLAVPSGTDNYSTFYINTGSVTTYLKPKASITGDVAYLFDTVNTLTSSYRAQFLNNGINPINFEASGSINIPSGATYKINNINLSYLDVSAKPLQLVGQAFNPTNPVTFERDYQYNSYTVSTNITITKSLIDAVALNKVELTLIGDGVHTVTFSGILQDGSSVSFDNTLNSVNKVTLFYDGTDVYYSIPSSVELEEYLGLPSVSGYILSSTTAGVRSWIAPPTTSLVDDILDFNTDRYSPYTSKPSGLGFYTGTTNPDGTTRLNLNGDFWPTMVNISSGSNTGLYIQNVSSSGAGVLIQTRSGKPLEIDFAGNLTGNLTTNMFDISRISTGGSYNITGNIINITDNPTTSGTISGKILSATIGSTERISLNPRVVSTGSAVAYILDTNSSLTIGDKIISVRNNGSEVTSFDLSGINTGLIKGGQTTLTQNGSINGYHLALKSTSTDRTILFPNIIDGASSIAYLFDTHNNLTTSGAKLVSFKNQGVEKVYIDKDGKTIGLGGGQFGDNTNNSTFEADGTLMFNGNATVWDDIDFPIIIRTTGANIPTIATTQGNLTSPQWAVNDFAVCEKKEIPHGAKIGASTYQWHIHIETGGTNVDNRYIAFEIEWNWANKDAQFSTPATISSGDLLIPANTPANTHLSFNINSAFSLASQALGAHIKPRLKRVTSTGTAPTTNPFCEMLQIHFEMDTLGSRQITTKYK